MDCYHGSNYAPMSNQYPNCTVMFAIIANFFHLMELMDEGVKRRGRIVAVRLCITLLLMSTGCAWNMTFIVVSAFVIAPPNSCRLSTRTIPIISFHPTCQRVTSTNAMIAMSKIDGTDLHLRSDEFTVETIVGPWSVHTFNSTNAWGGRPLLMRQSFDPDPLPTWEELLDLACKTDNRFDDDHDDDQITSRIITHIPGNLGSFEVDFGPFAYDDLIRQLHTNSTSLNERDTRLSTLVLNDVDRWIPDVSDWMDTHFKFLPRWRRDDAQVSLAQTGGGIGNHVDNYDVFLIQISGSREWQIAPHHLLSVKDEYDNLVEESQVRILNMSSINTHNTGGPIPTVKLMLEVGDCLYLPPRIVHCGTAASDDCITLSVGCRAPSGADLLARMSEIVSSGSSSLAMRRYTDVALMASTTADSTSNAITGVSNLKGLSGTVKEAMKNLILDAVQEVLEDDLVFDELIGKLVTEPNRPTGAYPVPLRAMDEEWKTEIGMWADATATVQSIFTGTGGCCLRRAEGISFAWTSGSIPVSKLCGDVGSNPMDEMHYFRIYAHGRVFEWKHRDIHPDEIARNCYLLDRIANGPPLNREAIDDLGFILTENISSFLVELIEEGFLYGDEDRSS
jgi:ribosomal protein L16 Arg81 hydroxylase